MKVNLTKDEINALDKLGNWIRLNQLDEERVRHHCRKIVGKYRRLKTLETKKINYDIRRLCYL